MVLAKQQTLEDTQYTLQCCFLTLSLGECEEENKNLGKDSQEKKQMTGHSKGGGGGGGGTGGDEKQIWIF